MVPGHPALPVTEREAAVRRAIISVRPDYFSCSPETQERYRADLPREDRFRIQQSLLRSLFGIEAATPEEVESATGSFSDAQSLVLNSAMLSLTGIGDDFFFLNEYMADNTTLLDFKTVYDYDLDDYRHQESARQKETPGYVQRPYCGTLFQRWARLQIDGVFHYANLYLAAGYLHGRLEDDGFDKIDALIPHTYVPGKNHGKRERSGTIFDQRVDAGGLEGQLEELQDRYYRYLADRSDALLSDFDTKASRRVYLLDCSREGDPHVDIVFTDKTALQAVRFQHLMRDCRSILGDPRELETLLEQERQALFGFLEQAHQDILQNFDPKVVKLRKKRKIIFTDEALNDLL
jgi:hypothetical protein